MHNEEKKPDGGSLSFKKIAIWMALFAVIAVASIWAVKEQSDSFSAADFWGYIKNADIVYLISAVASMLGFVIFEGLAVITLCRAVGYKPGFRDGFIYSASDIYFSAITPSASGGQPASIWFMMKDGISGMTSIVILLANLVLYTASILLIGAVTFICAPDMFFGYSSLSQILIVIGYIALALLALLFVLVLFKGDFVEALGSKIIAFLTKIKLIKRPERFYNKLQSSMARYKECSHIIFKNKRYVLLAFLFNFLQRASQITVTLFAYLSVGGALGSAPRVWFAQSYAVMGSNCMPVPGAMGILDYLLLDGLGNLMPYEDAVLLELFSRTLSFYSMVLLCGIAILIKYISILRKKKRGTTK